MHLTSNDRSMLEGDAGPGTALAMRIVVRMAEAMGGEELLDIESAHIDSCLYHGPVGLDFVRRLVDGDARVRVPSSLNVSAIDARHPGLVRGSERFLEDSAETMRLYEALGCSPTWSCAPYQGWHRPAFGSHVAWAESNAIVFANSVLGARTHRYGDFIDIACAVTGRAPAAGLHLTEHRRGRVVYRLAALPERAWESGVVFPVMGHLIGGDAGSDVAVIVGIDSAGEDDLKALGAAAGSSGSVALIHVVGITPEAPTLADALQGHRPEREVVVTAPMLAEAERSLTTAAGSAVGAVSLGTPHYSLSEIGLLVALLGGRTVSVPTFVNVGREVTDALPADMLQSLSAAGVSIVSDTCAYIAPIIRTGPVMTDSAKAAYYLPGNLDTDSIFGSQRDCVESAVAGRVVRSGAVWHG